MKLFTFLGLLLLFNSVALVSSSQTVISTETFPNPFNTDYISPVNQGFNEDIGQWAGYSTDAYSAAAVDDQYRVTDPFSLKLINRQTSKGTQQSVASATSPIITCTSTCVTSLSLNFKINPVNVNADNSFYKFYVDVSSDNGLTWTTMIVKTAADIANSYGTRKWNDVTIQIPSQFFTSSFRYRFVGVQQAGCNYDNWLYIDDVKVIATPCTATGNLTLGNQVWNDRDGDGKRDDNEPAIGGATISLYTDNDSDNLPDGAAIKTTQSDAQGIYHFTNLAPGRYIVSMPILPGYQQSPNKSTQATSPFPDNNVDNDDNLVRRVGPNGPGGILYTNAITLTEGQEPDDNGNTNNTLDLAECGNSWIGDFVWNDLNGNGIQDAGEPGINGVKVTITFEDGRTATDITHTYNAANNQNAPQYDGYYDFKNLGPGTYKITFETPAGFTASPALQGPDRAKDSNPINGTTSTTLAANQSDFTIDAGFTNNASLPPSTCPNLSVGNMVFNDLNGDGKKQPAEPGIGGLTVNLYADSDGNNVADDAPISTLVTAEDGTYYFGNLGAGKYIVGVAIDKNYALGANADLTPDDNKDNDNNGARMINGEVQSNYITLSPGDEPINDGSDNNSNLTLDFGLKIVCDNHCNCHNDCNHTGCGHPNCGQRSDKDCPGATTTAGYFGGFEAGAANFSSSTGNTDLRYGLPRNGSYEIVEKAKDAGGGGYLKTVAHSGSKMMVLHSSFNANCRLWSTTMNVIPGKTYTFCVWVANVKQDPVNGFALTLNAGNTIIAAASADFNWSRICGTYTVPDGVTSVEFSIKDPFPEIGASHFLALDDICIATTNAPAGSTDQSRSATASPVYPNPAGTYFNLNLTASKASTAEIRLINMNGKTIFRETRQVVKGLNSILIDRIKNVTGGTYNVQILIDGQVINQTLIISR